jgi:hypothetical protein
LKLDGGNLPPGVPNGGRKPESTLCLLRFFDGVAESGGARMDIELSGR